MYPFLNIPSSPYTHPNYSVFRSSVHDQYPIPYNAFSHASHPPERSYPIRDKALRPPQISLSTQTIFRYRNFTVTITVSEEWRIVNRLRPEDIIKSALSATCHKESGSNSSSTNTEVKYCKVCQGDRKIIEIDHSDQNQIGPVITTDGLEKYTFNKCKSFLLCLCLTLPVPGSPFYSAPFVLQAREKRAARRCVDIMNDVGSDISVNNKVVKIKKEQSSISVEQKPIDGEESEDIESKIEDVLVFILYITSNDFVKMVVDAFVDHINKTVDDCVVKVRITNKIAFILNWKMQKKNGVAFIRNTDGCTNYANADMVELGIIQKYLLTSSEH
ncbi:RRM domain-containing protein [Entamoeba marina]